MADGKNGYSVLCFLRGLRDTKYLKYAISLRKLLNKKVGRMCDLSLPVTLTAQKNT